MIHFTCPQCSEELESPDCLVGEQETCPACKTAVQVPPPDIAPPAETQAVPPAPFAPDAPADVDVTPPPTDEPIEPETQTPAASDAPAEPAAESPPAPFAAQEPVDLPEPQPRDDDDISLGIFDDAPNAEADIQADMQSDAQRQTTQPQPDQPEPTEQADDDMPPPSAPQVNEHWGILDHAKAAETEVTEDDRADVSSFAIGPQDEEPEDDDVSEEDTVTQIDIAALTAAAQPQATPSAPAAVQNPSAGVFIPGMPTDEPTPGDPPVQGPPKPAKTRSVRPLAPKPLLLLGGLEVLVGVLASAIVVILGLIRGGVLPIENYTFLEGLLAYRPMILVGVNAALLLLAGVGCMLMRRYAKIIGWFWIIQIIVVLGVEIYLRLQAGTTTLEQILQPAPLGLISGSLFLALLSGAALFAYGNRFTMVTAAQTSANEDSAPQA